MLAIPFAGLVFQDSIIWISVNSGTILDENEKGRSSTVDRAQQPRYMDGASFQFWN